MIPILFAAEAVTAPSGFGVWATCAVFVLSAAVLVKDLWPKRRSPPIEAEFATKTEFKEHAEDDREEFRRVREMISSRNRDLFSKLDEMKSDINNCGERRAVTLHERLNYLDKSVAALDERTKKL